MQRRQDRIHFQVLPDQRLVEASQGESLLDCLLRHKIHLDHSCGGFGTCSTCRVEIVEAVSGLSPRNEIEQEMATDRNFRIHERLACQTQACAGLVIRIPEQRRAIGS